MNTAPEDHTISENHTASENYTAVKNKGALNSQRSPSAQSAQEMTLPPINPFIQVGALLHKEFLSLFSDMAIIVPLFISMAIFSIALPFGAVLIPLMYQGNTLPDITLGKLANTVGAQDILSHFPTTFIENMPLDLTLAKGITWVILNLLSLPFFLLLLCTYSAMMAADSFVGERERHTIEGILATPTSLRTLLFTKGIFSSLISWIFVVIGYTIYAVLSNFLTSGWMPYFVAFNAQWILAIFIIGPLISFACTLLVMAVSARARSVKSAQNISIFIGLPIIGWIVSVNMGYLVNTFLVLIIGFVVLAIFVVILFFIVSFTLRPQKMLGNYSKKYSHKNKYKK